MIMSGRGEKRREEGANPKPAQPKAKTTAWTKAPPEKPKHTPASASTDIPPQPKASPKKEAKPKASPKKEAKPEAAPEEPKTKPKSVKKDITGLLHLSNHVKHEYEELKKITENTTKTHPINTTEFHEIVENVENVEKMSFDNFLKKSNS